MSETATKVIFLIGYIFSLTPRLNGQSQDFEGIISYQIEVRSKANDISDEMMKKMLAVGDQMTVHYRQGNSRHSGNIYQAYFLPEKKKVFYKFRNLDTLYFLDYSFDTAQIINISRDENKKSIAGYSCNSIKITTTKETRKFHYSPLLHLNSELEKENTLGKFNIYTKETESVYLESEEETENYRVIHTAVLVEKKHIEDKIFELPSLPEKKLTREGITREPVFTRNGGWMKYLQQNLNANLAAKHVRIPRGENSVTQQVMVFFIVSETGQLQNIKVLNPGEVHPKLAEEAVRVVTESGPWKPATMYGEKVSFAFKQPVTFVVTKE